MPKDEIWRQIQSQHEEVESGSVANSSVLGGVVSSEGTVERDTRSRLEKDNYSNFKAEHANMFSINTRKDKSDRIKCMNKHCSLSPKTNKINKSSPGSRESKTRKNHSTTMYKKSSKQAKLSSPLIGHETITIDVGSADTTEHIETAK